MKELNEETLKKIRQDVCAEALLYLESYDCQVTSDNVIRVVKEWAENLRSQVGAEAHERLINTLGVKDCTGMTWEQEDKQMLEEAERYEEFVEYFSAMRDMPY